MGGHSYSNFRILLAFDPSQCSTVLHLHAYLLTHPLFPHVVVISNNMMDWKIPFHSSVCILRSRGRVDGGSQGWSQVGEAVESVMDVEGSSGEVRVIRIFHLISWCSSLFCPSSSSNASMCQWVVGFTEPLGYSPSISHDLLQPTPSSHN